MSSPGFELLCQCLELTDAHLPALRAVDPTAWQAVLESAIQHDVAVLLYHRLKTKGLLPQLPSETAEALRSLYLYGSAENLRLLTRLRQILQRLHAAGIQVILLKGAHLTAGVYEKPALRQMGDVDLLARDDDLPALMECLTQCGYALTREFAQDTRHAHNHLPPLVQDGWPTLEVHTRLMDERFWPGLAEMDIWGEPAQLLVEGVAAQGLAPEMLILHLCLHAMRQHEFESGLKAVCDLAEVCRAFASELDWEKMLLQARSARAEGYAFAMLGLARWLLDAPVPLTTWAQCPNAVDDELLMQMKDIIAAPVRFQLDVSDDFGRLLSAGSLKEKITLLWKRIFVPPEWLEYDYQVKRTAPFFWVFYLHHFWLLLRRYTRTFIYRDRQTVTAIQQRGRYKQRIDAILRKLST